MSMTRRVTQQIGNCVQADVAAVVIKLHKLLQNLELRSLGKRLMNLRILESVDSLHANVQDQGIDARRVDIVSFLLEQTRQHASYKATVLVFLEEGIEVGAERQQRPQNIRQNDRALSNLGQGVNLQI